MKSKDLKKELPSLDQSFIVLRNTLRRKRMLTSYVTTIFGRRRLKASQYGVISRVERERRKLKELKHKLTSSKMMLPMTTTIRLLITKKRWRRKEGFNASFALSKPRDNGDVLQQQQLVRL